MTVARVSREHRRPNSPSVTPNGFGSNDRFCLQQIGRGVVATFLMLLASDAQRLRPRILASGSRSGLPFLDGAAPARNRRDRLPRNLGGFDFRSPALFFGDLARGNGIAGRPPRARSPHLVSRCTTAPERNEVDSRADLGAHFRANFWDWRRRGRFGDWNWICGRSRKSLRRNF